MKTVYFIRHAKSSWEDSSLADIDRPLNKRGRRDAPFMSKMLRKKGVRPDLLLSSSANRAYTTATFFARALEVDEAAIRVEPRIYHANSQDMIDLIKKLPSEVDTALVFGHNPTYTSVANIFAVEPIENVPTCGIFRIDAGIDSWGDFGAGKGQLTAFYYPKQFK